MKITIDFGALDRSLEKMGAKPRKVIFAPIDYKYKSIDVRLRGGFEVDWSDIVITKDGLISVDGRQALLYIQDHSFAFQKTIQDPSRGNKFHVSFCPALERMKNAGRYQRYIATNNTSGSFYITGSNRFTKNKEDDWVKLNVCKYCLSKLDYKGYRTNKNYKAFTKFSLEDFFKTYQTHFKHMPSRNAEESSGYDGYSENWGEVSRAYRASVGWKCEKCGVDLSSNRSLLDTHHKNGVKSDESRSNLMALCKLCHSKEPMHNHVKVSPKKANLIREKRKEQGISAY